MNKINLKQVVNSLTSAVEGAGISLKMDRERGKHELLSYLSVFDSSLLSAWLSHSQILLKLKTINE